MGRRNDDCLCNFYINLGLCTLGIFPMLADIWTLLVFLFVCFCSWACFWFALVLAQEQLILLVSFHFGVFSFESLRIFTELWTLGWWFFVYFCSFCSFGLHTGRCDYQCSCKSSFMMVLCTLGICHILADIWSLERVALVCYFVKRSVDAGMG